MRHLLTGLALLAALCSSFAGSLQAAKDGLVRPAARLELLVLEIETCDICGLVRQRILPRYELSAHARTVPMRFIDITRLDETKLGLSSMVDTLPTIVLMRDGQEVERFIGYMGPENFLRSLSHLLRSQGE